MTILVTGAKGVVGSYCSELRDHFSASLDLTDVDQLDITDLEAVMGRFREERYSSVVHLASETDVDRCEREPAHAYRLNTAGAWNIALAARAYDAEMLFVSTIQVFGGDGRAGPFSELETPSPSSVYDRSKLAAEESVRSLVARSYIVRTNWVMGGGRLDKKMVGKFRQRLLSNEPITAIDDRVGSLTFARDLVGAFTAILATGAYGTYHMTNSGVASPFTIAQEMKSLLGSKSEIRAVPGAQFKTDAPRPHSTAAACYALRARGLGQLIRPWQEALAEYLASW